MTTLARQPTNKTLRQVPKARRVQSEWVAGRTPLSVVRGIGLSVPKDLHPCAGPFHPCPASNARESSSLRGPWVSFLLPARPLKGPRLRAFRTNRLVG